MQHAHSESPILSSVRAWLWIAVWAVGIAGIFSVLLVAGRSPVVSNLVGVRNLFDVALAVHVDLSVLLWFLAMAGAYWAWALARQSAHWIKQSVLNHAAFCFAGSVALLTISPWFGGEMIKSNYIPVLTNAVFFAALSLLALGVGLGVLATLTDIATPPAEPIARLWHEGGQGLALILLSALIAFAWTYPTIPAAMGPDYVYEHLFWAGGHILQFAYTQLLMLLWLLLASDADAPWLRHSLWRRVLNMNALFGIAGLVAFAAHAPDSAEFQNFYTQHMRLLGGLAPLAMLLVFLPKAAPFLRLWRRDALASSLVASIGMVLFGGFLGWLIGGSDTRVPAHYHGVIVGITIATMGFVYWLLPKVGQADVRGWKMARLQPLIYAGGQFLHVTALAVSGGYGALRKTPGGFKPGLNKLTIAMGAMGLGGTIAIIGGLLFVVVCARAWKRRPISDLGG